jgi:hypothetical protein
MMFMDQPPEKCWWEWECESYDVSCTCQYERRPLLTLRGLCAAHYTQGILDSLYTPRQLPGNPSDLFLLGPFTTQIRYNESSSRWVLTDARYSVTGESEANKLSYLLGKHWWTMHDDTFCNKTLQRELTGQTMKTHGNVTTFPNTYDTWYSYNTQLKLTGCVGEFTCDDGQCVKMEERCDQLMNCRDESDEKDCYLLILKDSYNMRVPPVIQGSGSSFDPAMVGISIALLKIVSMDEVNHLIDFQFEITLEWRDNRATFLNLKREMVLNALSDEEIWSLWLPYVIYSNTDMKEAVQLEDGLKTIIVVAREGNFTLNEIYEVDEVEIFSGDENPLTMKQTYTKSFQCQYMLHRYPFDTQVTFVINTFFCNAHLSHSISNMHLFILHTWPLIKVLQIIFLVTESKF